MRLARPSRKGHTNINTRSGWRDRRWRRFRNSDRRPPCKRVRPLAIGRLPLGAAAAGTVLLLAFSMFAFLSLALAKRCAELVSLRQRGSPAASERDYQASDLDVLRPLGIGAALAAVVVFGLFIRAPGTTLRYGYPNLLWVVALGFIYLFARLWIATVRGEMRGDPVVYLLENRGSLAMLGGIVLTTMLAHTITVD